MGNVGSVLQSLAENIREAGNAGRHIMLRGGGTHSFGGSGETLSTESLNKVVEYAPDDMTITVEAGLLWNDLQHTLRSKKQWLPIEPPMSAKSTVGGILAVNASGASRYIYGTFRNWLIGARYVTANGDIVHSGSKVVKSVAGYDVHKLLIGSFGTLAAIADMTFKVAPLSERRTIVAIHTESTTDHLPALMPHVHDVSPTFVIYCNKLFAEQSPLTINANTLLIGLDGFTEDVEMQIKKLRELFALQHVDITVNDMNLNQLYDYILRFTLGKPNAVRIASLPSDTAKLVKVMNNFPAIIDIANGTVDVVPDAAQASSLSSLVTANGFRAVYLWQNEKSPLVDAAPEAEKNLARRLKETFDPRGLFTQRGYYL